jgi:hypothetical protein
VQVSASEKARSWTTRGSWLERAPSDKSGVIASDGRTEEWESRGIAVRLLQEAGSRDANTSSFVPFRPYQGPEDCRRRIPERDFQELLQPRCCFHNDQGPIRPWVPEDTSMHET